jgi:hypothetical protein
LHYSPTFPFAAGGLVAAASAPKALIRQKGDPYITKFIMFMIIANDLKSLEQFCELLG